MKLVWGRGRLVTYKALQSGIQVELKLSIMGNRSSSISEVGLTADAYEY